MKAPPVDEQPPLLYVVTAAAADDDSPLATNRISRRSRILRKVGLHCVGSGVCAFVTCFFVAPMVSLLIMTIGKRKGLMGPERAAVIVPCLVVALCSVTCVAATVYLACAALLVILTTGEDGDAGAAAQSLSVVPTAAVVVACEALDVPVSVVEEGRVVTAAT